MPAERGDRSTSFSSGEHTPGLRRPRLASPRPAPSPGRGVRYSCDVSARRLSTMPKPARSATVTIVNAAPKTSRSRVTSGLTAIAVAKTPRRMSSVPRNSSKQCVQDHVAAPRLRRPALVEQFSCGSCRSIPSRPWLGGRCARSQGPYANRVPERIGAARTAPGPDARCRWAIHRPREPTRNPGVAPIRRLYSALPPAVETCVLHPPATHFRTGFARAAPSATGVRLALAMSGRTR